MAFYLPEEEALDAATLAALQRRKLRDMLEVVLSTNPFYRQKLRGVTANVAVERYGELPFTTREELQRDQIEHPPYGTNLTFPFSEYRRLHQTSGSAGTPLRVLDRAADWQWWHRCWGIIYRGAGVTARDRFVFPFSFGPFIGFWAAFESAVALGNLCLPAGGMTTAARLQYLTENAATVVCCTPTYALRMAEAARELDIDLKRSAVRLLIVAGEPGGSLPATRGTIEQAWGARVIDHTGMTEVGPHGFECAESPGGVHLIESEFIVESLDPATGRPAPDGELGELVVTNLGRWGMPVIRYRTGDQVRLTREKCPCGRRFARMVGGIPGRIDDLFFIRGNNVYPSVIEDLVRGVNGVAEFRFHVDSRDAMPQLVLELEPADGADAATMVQNATEAIQDRLHFKPLVRTVATGTLPRTEMKSRRYLK